MKPSAHPTILASQRSPLGLALFALLLVVWSLNAAASQPSFHFSLEQYQGATMTYLLTTTGTLEMTGERDQPVILSFEISSPIDVSFAAGPSDGDLPFELTMRSPVLSGLEEAGQQRFDPITLRGRLSPAGALKEIESPPFLAEVGIDMTDLVIGLVVPSPSPSRDVTPGTDWRATLARGAVVRESARSLDLTATYTAGREVDWGHHRSLLSVTARLRADASLREGSLRTEIQEIGHALFYVQPGTGIPELSSVSVITQIETRPTYARTAISRTKTTLTTTLELREIDRASKLLHAEDTPEPALAPVTESPGAPAPPSLEADDGEAASESPIPGPGADTPVSRQEPGESPVDIHEVSETDILDDVESPALSKTQELPEPGASPEDAPPDEAAGEPLAQQPPVPQVHPPVPAAVYEDPAGRFELGLGPEWIPQPRSLTLRGTTFVTEDGAERAYVYVMPLPSPAATALAIARSTLATYGETQTSFRVLSEPEPDVLDGQTAYRAQYIYKLGEETLTEWALFARMRDRAYYVQYARVGDFADDSDAGWEKLDALRHHFRFGPNPRGQVPAERLEESFSLYVDPHGRFSMQVPSLWPRTETAADGSSTIFTEIGERGHLTILVQTGASGFTAAQIVSAWKEQLAQDDGFTILVDVTPETLAGHSGVRMEYSWSEGATGDWSRRLHATVVDDTFFAVAIDYEAPRYEERVAIFDKMIESFTTLLAPSKTGQTPGEESVAPPLPLSTGEDAPPVSPGLEKEDAAYDRIMEPIQDDTRDDETAAASPRQEPAEPESPDIPSPDPSPEDTVFMTNWAYPFAEPVDEESVILLGRILTRYPGPSGETEEAWASGLQVTVLAGQDEYTGTTDELGYVYVTNLPRLPQGRLYTVTRLDGPMLGFVESVTVSFDNLRIGAIGPRVAHLRTIILTLHADRTLSVDIVRAPDSAPDDPSALEYFVKTYPDSAWANDVREVILSGLD